MAPRVDVIHHIQHFTERHRFFFRTFRLLAVVLLALVIWDPLPGLLQALVENQAALVFVILALFILTLVVSFDFLTRTQRDWQQLIFKYFFLMVSVILLFGMLYLYAENHLSESGLRSVYRYTPERDAFYFSATTYFTVGYGDYLPYGAAKTLAMFEAALGNIINLVVMAIALTRFTGREENSKINAALKKNRSIIPIEGKKT